MLEIRPPAPPDIEDADPAFVSWLRERGLPQQQVALREVPGQGRGLVARCPIRKGTPLLQVPLTLAIDPERAFSESCLGPLLPAQGLPDWTVLAVWLVEQRHLLRSGAPDACHWGPYLAQLPEACGTVLEWPKGEVGRLLAGSGLEAKAADILAAADATWRELAPVVRDAEARGATPRGVFSERAVRWALSVLLSRLIRLDSRGGMPVLVPWADFLNHGCGANAYIDWDEGTESVVLRPDRDYRAGDQVLASYGPKSSGELLLSYGFCPAAATNPHEAAHLTLSLDRGAQAGGGGGGGGGGGAVGAAKARAMTRRGVPTAESFALRIDALPDGLLAYLAFLDAQPEGPEGAEDLAEVVLGRGELPTWQGQDLEVVALEGLATRCKRALTACPAPTDETRQRAAAAASGGGFEQREALCAALRLNERRILERTEYVARTRAKTLRQQQRNGGGARRRG